MSARGVGRSAAGAERDAARGEDGEHLLEVTQLLAREARERREERLALGYLKRRLTAVDAAFFSQWAWSTRILVQSRARARATQRDPSCSARLSTVTSVRLGRLAARAGPDAVERARVVGGER
jgi:hypothetical protein